MVIFAASAVHREPAAAAAAPAIATAADLRAASPGVDNAAVAITVATPALRAGGAAQATAATPPTRRRSRRLKKKAKSRASRTLLRRCAPVQEGTYSKKFI